MSSCMLSADVFCTSQIPMKYFTMFCQSRFVSPLVVILLVHLVTSDDESSAEDSARLSALKLRDIEYEGTWDRFCSATEIDKDFTNYPEHDLKHLRKIICKLRQDNNVTNDRKSLLMFGTYKYCLSMRFQFDYFFNTFVGEFSSYEDKKKAILLSPGPTNETTPCFNSTVETFFKSCVGKQNPCIRMFKFLLARTCVQPWIETETMQSQMSKICDRRWISDEIDWDVVFKTMNLKVDCRND